MKNFKLTSTLLFMLLSICFIGCSSDDDENSLSGSADQLVGKSYVAHTMTYSDIGEPNSDNEEIKFVSETQCKIRTWGYWYNYYDDGSQDRNSYDYPAETYSYRVSNSTIYILNYFEDPINAGTRDRTLTYAGDKLIEGSTIFNITSESSIEDDEPVVPSTLNVRDFLYKWYDAAECADAQSYKHQGNMELYEKSLTHGIVFENSTSGYYWYKDGTKIVKDAFTWSLGNGSKIKINHPYYNKEIVVGVYFEDLSRFYDGMMALTLKSDYFSCGEEDYARMRY